MYKRQAQKSGLEVDTVILSSMSHAGYYPGGKAVSYTHLLSKYFDTLNHEILINLLRKNVKDERVVQLIKR